MVKAGDYIKAQEPEGWPLEGTVKEVISNGLLDYQQIVFELNPELYPVTGTIELSERWVAEVNGEKYNWYRQVVEVTPEMVRELALKIHYPSRP